MCFVYEWRAQVLYSSELLSFEKQIRPTVKYMTGSVNKVEMLKSRSQGQMTLATHSVAAPYIASDNEATQLINFVVVF